MRLHVRIDSDAKEAFESACATANVVPADIVREMMAYATARLIADQQWRPSDLDRPKSSSAQDMAALVMKELLNPESPMSAVMETVIARTRERRLIAADQRETYQAGASAEAVQRQQIMPPAAPIARTPARNSGAVRVEANKMVIP